MLSIQIQLLFLLIEEIKYCVVVIVEHSNTTLVSINPKKVSRYQQSISYSNTTLVSINPLTSAITISNSPIQIQLLFLLIKNAIFIKGEIK